jgi:hypothetical protein
MKKALTLAPGAVIEPVGDDVMVMMPGNTDILRISGPAADTLRTIVAGQPVDPSTPTVLELANQGIISPSGMSRRGLIRAGAIGAGAGIAVLAMPTAAMASSELPSFDAMGTYQFISNEWRFTLLKADFPDETQFGLGNLTIDGNAFDSQSGPTSKTWFDRVGGPSTYTGIVIGTLVGIDTGDSYTVGFTEVTAG